MRNETELISCAEPIYSSLDIKLDPKRLNTLVRFPKFLNNVLLVYRVTPKLSGSCEGPSRKDLIYWIDVLTVYPTGALLPPVLLHSSGLVEGHYHRLRNNHPVLLHGHSSGPFIPIPPHLYRSQSRGLNLTIFSSTECGVKELQVTVDWWYSFSRWGPRYWNAILAWSAGVIGFVFFKNWMVFDSGGKEAHFCASTSLDSYIVQSSGTNTDTVN